MDWLDAAYVAEEYWENLSPFDNEYCSYLPTESCTSSPIREGPRQTNELVVPKINFEIPPPRRKKSAKSKWTPEEDNLLKSLAKSLDCDWPKIVKHFPSMTISSVQRRWNNKLDPNIKKARWSKEEDEIIVKLYNEIGGNWKIISQKLEGRPPNAIKNRFYGALKRKLPHVEQPEAKVPEVAPKPIPLNLSEDVIVNSFFAPNDEISTQDGLLGEEAFSMLNIEPTKLEDLSAEDKKQRISELYSRMSSIEGVLLNTQLQIRDLEEQISLKLSR
mmetsp:Transcript_22644/g.40758  ORF Transcript_22644/g.40758 Transcript_22644/m.40758 type:complete len:274 (+) Transcript_22644:2758-3579(+)